MKHRKGWVVPECADDALLTAYRLTTGERRWTSLDGRIQFPEQFTTGHLKNTIKHIENRYDDEASPWSPGCIEEVCPIYPALVQELKRREIK